MNENGSCSDTHGGGVSQRTPFRASDGSLWRCKQWFTCRLAMPLPKQGQDPVGAETERLGWELDSQGATRSETTCLGLCLRVKLSSLGAQGACLALLLRAPSRFYTLSIEILTLFFLGSGASSHSQHSLTKHATSASGLRCTACPLAILRWRCPAIQSPSLVAPRKDSYLNNNPFYTTELVSMGFDQAVAFSHRNMYTQSAYDPKQPL